MASMTRCKRPAGSEFQRAAFVLSLLLVMPRLPPGSSYNCGNLDLLIKEIRVGELRACCQLLSSHSNASLACPNLPLHAATTRSGVPPRKHTIVQDVLRGTTLLRLSNP